MTIDQSNHLQRYADDLVEKHNAPAVSIAIWNNQALTTAAAGILNINTGVEATTDSIFQIGSVTKVMTACLVMQLVDEGRVELDAPVKTYMPDFLVADKQATESITVRQLLNHTNGIAGDFFPNDRDAEGNAIARYLDRINGIPLVHEPGKYYSYSNGAYAVAGRLVEVMTGLPWHRVMRERIFDPLGMTQATADPKEVLRYRAAMGHFADAQQQAQWLLSPRCYSTLGLAPAGTTVMMSAADLITFARAQMNGGKTESGEQWLSVNSIGEMQSPSVTPPDSGEMLIAFKGLGWGIFEPRAPEQRLRILSHEGMVAGQNATLRLFPEQSTAFAVLLNGVKPGVMAAIVNELTEQLVGIDTQPPPPKPANLDGAALASYSGKFQCLDASYEVAVGEHATGSFVLNVCMLDRFGDSSRMTWVPLGNDCFAAYDEQNNRLPNITFIEAIGSIPQYLFVGGRLNQRVTSPGDHLLIS